MVERMLRKGFMVLEYYCPKCKEEKREKEKAREEERWVKVNGGQLS